MSVPDRVAVYECGKCKSRREQDAARSEVPECGVLHTDTDVNRFPAGHWVRVTTEHYDCHGPMVLVEELAGNPFAADLALRDEMVAREADRYVKRVERAVSG